MRTRLAAVLTSTLLALGTLAAAPAPAQASPGRDHRVTPCSRGLVALTFDDGPSATVTRRLVRLLRRLEVPATFFMVGTRVAAYPALARQVHDGGFTIGSHTWAHTDLTQQTDREIRDALKRTRHALVAAGVPAPALVRPPYGAIDGRVRGVLTAAGYTPVLWTIDSRDWDDGTSRQIADRVLAAVHPHRANVVLQHDGVARSPLTLRALPREISVLRKRGYCFAALGPDGRPTPPVPPRHGDRRSPPGARASTLTLPVPPGVPRDGDQQLPARIVRVVHAAAGPDAMPWPRSGGRCSPYRTCFRPVQEPAPSSAQSHVRAIVGTLSAGDSEAAAHPGLLHLGRPAATGEDSTVDTSHPTRPGRPRCDGPGRRRSRNHHSACGRRPVRQRRRPGQARP